jgi:hypothetical protein
MADFKLNTLQINEGSDPRNLRLFPVSCLGVIQTLHVDPLLPDPHSKVLEEDTQDSRSDSASMTHKYKECTMTAYHAK